MPLGSGHRVVTQLRPRRSGACPPSPRGPRSCGCRAAARARRRSRRSCGPSDGASGHGSPESSTPPRSRIGRQPGRRGSGSNSTIAAPNFSVRAARLDASFAIATPWCNSAIVIAVSSGVTAGRPGPAGPGRCRHSFQDPGLVAISHGWVPRCRRHLRGPWCRRTRRPRPAYGHGLRVATSGAARRAPRQIVVDAASPGAARRSPRRSA